MKNKELIFKLLEFFKPKFYNRITWVLIIGGLGLFSTPLIERILYALLEKIINIPISDENASIYGVIVIFLGLIYNSGINYLEYKKELLSQNISEQERIQRTLDLKLLNRIREILPSDGSIEYLKERNFAGFGFRWTDLSQLKNYITEEAKPEFTFIDSELETIRKDLTTNIYEFLSKLSVNSWYLEHSQDIASVPQEWEIDQPERFWGVVNYLSERQDKSWQAYELLISTGRRKLGE